ncbi:alpha/beta fold hydrolase [Tsukamurella sp. 8F]|uniref:alpha/beta fold hydrolase n=1 Tax=unclassified Tsukamurella TaxID=2633480 RepID=UPI0023B9F515|nr:MULTISPECIES: alpha/beta fold hydrolase [unclassified Tsukamurella]MDF0528839.1 alpha/beta fold hydrolase [Tsukamurella sp. 8J]MDF0586674.1 alpha/beta fold hydrolase [Tsukamurella sp. 8F]
MTPTMETGNPFGSVAHGDTPDMRALRVITAGDDARISVVFESGLGCAHGVWALVQPEVARFARTVVYDRAGYGTSDVDPARRTVARLADDLEVVLDAVSRGPAERFVLVGHSLGGLIVQYAAIRDPERVAALVLVDGVSLDMPALHGRGYRVTTLLTESVMRGAARIGLLQRIGAWVIDRLAPPEFADDIKRCEFTRAAMRARAEEMSGWHATLAEDGSEAVPLPDIPVAVMSGTRAPLGAAKMHEEIVAAHAALAAAQPQGRHIEVDAGHNIPITDPDEIVSAVWATVEALRAA